MKLRNLDNFVKILIALIVVLNNFSLFARPTGQKVVGSADTLTILHTVSFCVKRESTCIFIHLGEDTL